MNWWRDIYVALKNADVRQVVYVPDAGHANLIDACIEDNDINSVPLTTEEEGVAVLAGALREGRGVGAVLKAFFVLDNLPAASG